MSFTVQKKGAMFTVVDSETEESVGEYYTRREAISHLRMRLGFDKKSPRESLEKDKATDAEKKKAKEIADAKELTGLDKAEKEEE